MTFSNVMIPQVIQSLSALLFQPVVLPQRLECDGVVFETEHNPVVVYLVRRLVILRRRG